MRRGLVLFLIVNLAIIGLLVNYVFTLITLLFDDCSADAISTAEIPAPNSELIDQRPQLIPKIIHQTFQNESIPLKWKEAQQSCIDLHGDYEYKVCGCFVLVVV
jgi:mannosyltransferase OCH1-like enzyme